MICTPCDFRVVELSWPRVRDVRPRLADYLGEEREAKLDLASLPVTLATLERAAASVDKRLRVKLEELPARG